MLPRIFYFSFALLFCFACQQPSSSKTTAEGENQSQISSANNTVTHNADSNIEDFGIFLHVKPNHFKANDDSIKLVYVVTNNLDSIVQFGSYFIIEKWEGNEWKVVPFQDNIAFIDIMYGLEPGDAKEYPFPFVVFSDQVNRQPGKYRLLKEVFQRGKEDEKIRLVSEFVLE